MLPSPISGQTSVMMKTDDDDDDDDDGVVVLVDDDGSGRANGAVQAALQRDMRLALADQTTALHSLH